MQTFESIISFLVLISISMLLLQTYEIDSSLYQLKLAQDIWRVLYLKGDFISFDRNSLNRDLNIIRGLTSICVEFVEVDVASCLPKDPPIVIKRIAYINQKPELITMKIGVDYYD